MLIIQKKQIILGYFLAVTFSLFLIPSLLFAQSESSENAKVFIISPKNGAVVKNPVKVIFGLSGMKISPAGIEKKFAGHHHLLIDVNTLPDLAKPIPSDKNHIHFGKGQTETKLNLSSGKHSLQLLFADYLHIPHINPVISKKIYITVK